MGFFRHLYDTVVPGPRNHYRPHALSRRALSLYGGLMLSLKVLAVFSVTAIPVGQAYSSAISVANVISLTNDSRAASNLAPLTENAELDQAAQAKADDMLQNQYFAHTSPSGKTPWDFIEGAHYNYIIAGENLAINFYSAESVEQAWMNSPGHRANILNANFADIGVGFSQGMYQGLPAIFVVQEFGTSLPQPYLAKNPSDTASPAAAVPASSVLPVLQVSAAESSKIPAPALNQPDKQLIAGSSVTVSGTAQTPYAYLSVNGTPQVQAAVHGGTFTADVTLAPGTNAITASGFDGASLISKPSPAITFITAGAPPQILGTEITPSLIDGGTQISYQLTVHTVPSATTVIASSGDDGVMLQPTNTAGDWQAQLPSSSTLVSAPLTVRAYDMAGNTAASDQIVFSTSLADNYAFNASVQPAAPTGVTVFGIHLTPNAVNDIYVGLAVFLLLMLGLVIAWKVSTADIPLVAEASGIIALAIIIWAH